MAAPLTLQDVREEAWGRLYPRDRLQGLETALAGFCAGFLGRYDCVWLEDAGLQATCVDTDPYLLDQMAAIYPPDWVFVNQDIFDYADLCYAKGATFDVVCMDPWTNMFDVVGEAVDLWCSLARHLVVLGSGRNRVTPPDGWEVVSIVQRSTFRGGVYWTTLGRV